MIIFVAAVELLSGAASIFDDTVADFHSLPALFSRFQDWRTSCPHSYNDAYIAHCFPKLVAPFVRFQILGWNPIKVRRSPHCQWRKWSVTHVAITDSLTLQRPAPLTEMSWLEEILANAFVSPGDERVSSDDPDLRIIPMLIEDVVFSRLTGKRTGLVALVLVGAKSHGEQMQGFEGSHVLNALFPVGILNLLQSKVWLVDILHTHILHQAFDISLLHVWETLCFSMSIVCFWTLHAVEIRAVQVVSQDSSTLWTFILWSHPGG